MVENDVNKQKFQARDWNDLRVEHYAVDSCNLEMVKLIFDRGGDVSVKDNNGWSPLFRACELRHKKTKVIIFYFEIKFLSKQLNRIKIKK